MTEIRPETVFATFERTALRSPKREFLMVMPNTAKIYKIPSGPITYDFAYNEVQARASSFDQAGYKRGMRVALLLENRPDYFIIWLALNRLGISVVPINPELRKNELTYLIGHSETALIVAIPSRHDELRTAAHATGLFVPIIGPKDSIPAPAGGGVVADIMHGV